MTINLMTIIFSKIDRFTLRKKLTDYNPSNPIKWIKEVSSSEVQAIVLKSSAFSMQKSKSRLFRE